MALSASRLSAAMKSALLGQEWAKDGPELVALCDAIASTVVDEIVANALVAVPAAGLIAPGGMSPAPVTGAAVGSVS